MIDYTVAFIQLALSLVKHTEILFYLIVSPLAGCLVLLFIPRSHERSLRYVALAFSLASFLCSLIIWLLFTPISGATHFLYILNWIEFINVDYTLGMDGVSLSFVLLTTFLTPLCLLLSWGSVHSYVKEYLLLFLLLESILLHAFCALDVLLFYIFFESVLIPIFIIIGVWGSRQRKIRAALQFFLYTLVGSLLILLAILSIYYETGSTNILILSNFQFGENQQFWLWLAFFVGFAVKIPMVPFHIWLPEAHAEAPTGGSVILAGVLLKLGGYGFLRFAIPLFPHASVYFSPLVYVISIVAIIYASLTALRQVDLKKIIAYSSVAHIGYVTIGLFSFNTQGNEGSIILILGHGLVSSALFFCVGILYDRHQTRILKYYGGLVQTMPLFCSLYFCFTIANAGFPGTSNFVGEMLVLTGVFQVNTTVAFISAIGLVLGIAYSLWLYNRVCFGSSRSHYIQATQDLSRREFLILALLAVPIIWMGIYPSPFLDTFHASVEHMIKHIIKLL
uniref:NADH-ubiquinone oxidoreductase chain 4 n=1 Tax=Cavernulicola chilensis TaxID=3028028 RepID=A0A7H0WB67_9RHOD|nr:NADH dehydrogenase subunit 4 [Cavernulicola chilensis]QNR39796.1 NADH dehydrogenase subunit 4 [Cavernulicola chilensis]